MWFQASVEDLRKRWHIVLDVRVAILLWISLQHEQLTLPSFMRTALWGHLALESIESVDIVSAVIAIRAVIAISR